MWRTFNQDNQSELVPSLYAAETAVHELMLQASCPPRAPLSAFVPATRPPAT